MSTETTFISLQMINISRFLYFLTEDTILVPFQKKKMLGRYTEKHRWWGGGGRGGGIPSHSDMKSHFVLKITQSSNHDYYCIAQVLLHCMQVVYLQTNQI